MEMNATEQGASRATSPGEPGRVAPNSQQARSTLVFVHGWGGHGRFWQPQASHFAGHCDVVMPDLAGHGRAASQQGPYTLDRFAADLAEMIDQLEAPTCTLTGHSMGGAIALEAARKIPERVARVILVDAFVMDWGRLDESLINGFLSAFRDNFTAAVQGLIEQTCTQGTDPAVIAHAAKVMATLSPEVGLPALESLLRWDPLPAFKELKMPLDCINSVLVNPEARSRYAPFVTEHAVEGAGHYLQFEDEKGFNRLLDDILQSPK
ncbi:MAG TPA: alpha/beta hydrolase [Gammaproteobacteria bacterium]|nr:alpha/beta hydrolase [Gammaproteobacteria bacterium]